ncbi:MAG: DctP family TRAP transporter solute-binding subunit [Dehalobacterium sp.]
MKKLVLALMLISCLLILAACGQKEPAEPAEGAAQEEEKVVIKIAHVEADTDTLQACGLLFKEYAEKESGGSIEVQLYPNSELGADRQATEAVALGTVQMALPGTATLTLYTPKFGICDMPFIFSDTNAAFQALDNELGTTLNESLANTGLINLGYYLIGERHVSNNIRPINEPADMKGIDIRVMESPVYIGLFKALGANPTPINFGELYTALQQGTVDAEDNPASIVYTSKFYEVQKYYSLTGHTLSFGGIVINEKFFNSLSEKQQNIIKEGTRKFLVDEQRAMKLKDADSYLEKLKEEGMAINDITPENKKKFMDAVTPMYENFKKDIPQELFDLAVKYNK